VPVPQQINPVTEHAQENLKNKGQQRNCAHQTNPGHAHIMREQINGIKRREKAQHRTLRKIEQCKQAVTRWL